MPAEQRNGATALGDAPKPADPRALGSDDLLNIYRVMVLARSLDERIWLLNRQGKAAIVASVQGHEAAQVAAAWATDPERDHYLISYRELATALTLGLTAEEILLGFLARDGERMSSGRQFPLHGAHPDVDLINFSNVVASHLPQAAGFALADQMRGSDAVSIAYFGDGAASMGDTHEAMNFAAIHRLPLVFFCQNNRYAISVPSRKQMAIEYVAERAAGYGFPGVTVDGKDPIAVYSAMAEAVDRARAGGGPTLVEAVVERLLPHTSDDDHTRYRPAEEIATLAERDPIRTTEKQLRDLGILDEATKEPIRAEAMQEVNAATDAAESAELPTPESHDIYRNLYGDRYGD